MPNGNAVRRLTGGVSVGPVTAEAGRGRTTQQPLLRFEQYLHRYDATATQPARADDPAWLAEVLRTLLKFTALPEHWDSYSGSPLRWDVGMFALNVLSSIMQSQTPAPHLVPSSDGSLQIEWHQKGMDLELYITAPYCCEMSFHDHRTGVSGSEELTGEFTALTAPIAELTSR